MAPPPNPRSPSSADESALRASARGTFVQLVSGMLVFGGGLFATLGILNGNLRYATAGLLFLGAGVGLWARAFYAIPVAPPGRGALGGLAGWSPWWKVPSHPRGRQLCPACGWRTAEDRTVCPRCGKPLVRTAGVGPELAEVKS